MRASSGEKWSVKGEGNRARGALEVKVGNERASARGRVPGQLSG